MRQQMNMIVSSLYTKKEDPGVAVPHRYELVSSQVDRGHATRGLVRAVSWPAGCSAACAGRTQVLGHWATTRGAEARGGPGVRPSGEPHLLVLVRDSGRSASLVGGLGAEPAAGPVAPHQLQVRAGGGEQGGGRRMPTGATPPIR